jgi:hypothetical protein
LSAPRYAIFCHGIELERTQSEPLAGVMRGAWRLLINSAHTGRDVTRRFPDLEQRVRVTDGLPFIGSTADAAPEVIDAERTGRLVTYGDPEALAPAITELLADPPLRRAWGAEAMRQARARFGYERFRRDLLSALELDAV